MSSSGPRSPRYPPRRITPSPCGPRCVGVDGVAAALDVDHPRARGIGGHGHAASLCRAGRWRRRRATARSPRRPRWTRLHHHRGPRRDLLALVFALIDVGVASSASASASASRPRQLGGSVLRVVARINRVWAESKASGVRDVIDPPRPKDSRAACVVPCAVRPEAWRSTRSASLGMASVMCFTAWPRNLLRDLSTRWVLRSARR